jgi:mono/diheme cytochrome c family protein
MKRMLKILGSIVGLLLIIAVAILVYVLAVWNRTVDRPAPTLVARRDSATVARGEYIFKVTWQCWGCHQSSPRDANLPPSGGGVFDLRSTGPGFGVFYSANITPDSLTGLGAWTDGEIVQAMREGVRKDRHQLFPLMPVDWLKDLSDDDALAIVSYLRSIPPVRNAVPPSEPSIIAKALIAFHVIKPFPAIVTPIVAPHSGVTVEYGRYFAANVAGCADCHTPRNLENGQFYLDSLFAGGTFPFGESEGDPLVAFARTIRLNVAGGVGSWNEEQFALAVSAGFRRDSTVLAPHMPYGQYKFLAADDLRAIYLYLSSLPPLSRFTPQPRYALSVITARGVARGRLLFKARCQTCHGVEGQGASPTSVKLADAVPSWKDEELREFVAAGQLDLKMPAFRKTLSDDELSDLIAYVRTWRRP